MLALDPPLGDERAATIGGVLASGDSGPLRHRYGARARPRGRDHDGALRRHGRALGRQGDQERRRIRPREAAQRLVRNARPDPRARGPAAPAPDPEPATAVAACDRPELLGSGASAVAHSPLEAECLDVAWSDGRARCWPASPARPPPTTPKPRSRSCPRRAWSRRSGEADDELWERQRAGQRSADGVVLRVAGVQADLPRLAELADVAGASLVGRAGLGVFWLEARGPLRRGRGRGGGGAAGPPRGRGPAWCSTPPRRCAASSTSGTRATRGGSPSRAG